MCPRLAIITFLHGYGPGIDNGLPQPPLGVGYPLPTPPSPVDPGYGIPDYGAGRPDNSLPYPPARPTHPIHWPPVTPDNTLPGDVPVVSLPIVLPERGTKPVDPEQMFVLRWSPVYGWVIVPVGGDEAEPK